MNPILKIPSRKAQVEISLQQIIGLVIAIVIVLATLGLFFGLMNIFMGPPDEGSQATWKKVFKSASALYDANNHNTSCFIRPAYMKADWALVGFNKNGVACSTRRTFSSTKYISAIGEDSILETCGTNDALTKPGSCGGSSCVCLCDGGTGDVTGDDCSSSSSMCKMFPQALGITTLYTLDDTGDCYHTSTVGGESKGICDMVIYGEGCSGADRNVRYSLVLKKETNRDGAGGAVLVALVRESERATKYPDVTTECTTMVNDLERQRHRPPAQQTAATGSTPAGEDVRTAVDTTHMKART